VEANLSKYDVHRADTDPMRQSLELRLTSNERDESVCRPSYRTLEPTGRTIIIPASAREDFGYFTPDQGDAIRQYLRENGYVVIRKLIPAGLCQQGLLHFEREVANYDGYLYRQTTANPEQHRFTEHGFMLNPILNIQSLDARRFPRFRGAGLAILTHSAIQTMVRQILGEPGIIVQSMYFQGNPTTWPHQDTYYLDGEPLGAMIGVWFAVETIAPGAGRFFVYPKSHCIDMVRNGGNFDIAFNHDRYKKLVVDVIRDNSLECCAPALEQGDVLMWSSKTIHGSLPTTQPQSSRSSFTGHYIPARSRFLQFQRRVRRLDCAEIDGMLVHRPKDLNRWPQRVALWTEKSFPQSFQSIKKRAIKTVR
jgi:phytanoyl-CoA hydroxylase